MSIINVESPYTPEVKSHHKPRHLKKLAIGEFREDCLEIRFEGDIEQFEAFDNDLVELQQQQGYGLFIAYFGNRYHLALNYYQQQHQPQDVLSNTKAVINKYFPNAELSCYCGDAHYGDWNSAYSELTE
ncbi:hypothetical protein [Paraferrimonas sp. SM1919]|uniref:hypothetical protein n=1 Tax=Paraferrimonas sp. SM1919 TaxID=2662263 RepID=UPI0013D7EDBD|nr:hypothetical protein [Paraferrimonas sp. SM1919]